jgi:hypothetical protein
MKLEGLLIEGAMTSASMDLIPVSLRVRRLKFLFRIAPCDKAAPENYGSTRPGNSYTMGA